MVEAFHLGRAERLGAPRRVDTGREIAGRSSRTKATWRWAPRREGATDGEGPDGTGAARAAGAFWVWQVLATEVVYPCTASAPEGTDCHPVTSCTMRPEIFEVDADGLRPSTLDPATLARLQPKLAPVLREAEASSLGACKRLAKP